MGVGHVSDRRYPAPDRRTVLRTTAGVFGASILGGAAAASQHDVDAIFGDETGAPGESVTVPLSIEEANDPNAEVGAYDIEVDYDESVLTFTGASGVDLPDPTVTEPSPGTVIANAATTTGESVPITAVEFTFDIESDANPGGEGTVDIVDAESVFTDPVNDVSFESQAGTISVSGGSSFQVDITNTNTPVFEGDTLTAETLVENVGTKEDTQTIELEDFAGNVVDDKEETIQGGNSTSIQLDWTTSAGDAGQGQITVASADDTATATVEINESPDVAASLDDRTGAPGSEVTVTFAVDPESDDNAVVGAYDIKITYDETVVSFVDATGVDLPDPSANSPSPGTLVANAADTTGVSVPLTAAEFTFAIDGDASDGDSTDISFVTDDSALTDPVDPVATAFENGSVTVSDSGSLISYQVGDANTDGDRDVVDAVLTQQYLAGQNPSPFEPALADVNRDGDVTVIDAVMIQQHLADIRPGRNVEIIDITPDTNTVEAQLENSGGLGAWDEAQLWIVADGSEQAALLEGYRPEDPLAPADLADEIITSNFDLGPDGEQGSVQFDISGLSPGAYLGLVFTGEDAEVFSFTKS